MWTLHLRITISFIFFYFFFFFFFFVFLNFNFCSFEYNLNYAWKLVRLVVSFFFFFCTALNVLYFLIFLFLIFRWEDFSDEWRSYVLALPFSSVLMLAIVLFFFFLKKKKIMTRIFHEEKYAWGENITKAAQNEYFFNTRTRIFIYFTEQSTLNNKWNLYHHAIRSFSPYLSRAYASGQNNGICTRWRLMSQSLSAK